MTMGPAAENEGADPLEEQPDSLRRVTLEGRGGWLVTSGYADVFASLRGEPSAAGGPSAAAGGRRHHLFRVPTGAKLFGLPASPTLPSLHIEAIGTDATILTPITREDLQGPLENPDTRRTTLRAVESWIDRLCEAVDAGLAPADCVGEGAGQDVTLAESGCVRPVTGVLAVQVVAGAAQPFGRSESLGEGGVIALSWRAWVRVEAGGTLRLTALPHITEHADLWRALDTLHEIAMAGIADRLSKITAAERARYAARVTGTTLAGASAIGALAAAFYDVPPQRLTTEAPVSTAHDQLNAACRLVMDRLGVPFVKPSATTYRTVKEGIENIARASKFRTRHVTLEDSWWRHEQGPLLGFLKADRRPVALLPRGRRGYELVDPDGGAARRVNATVAATLTPAAVVFYRPFPPGPVTALPLARFSLRGCRRELGMILTTGAIAGAIGMGVPIVTGLLINTIIPSTDRAQLTQWTLMLLVCAAATAGFQVARSIALVRLEMKLGYALQAAVWDRLIDQPARFFRHYSAGDLATRAMGIDNVRQTLSGTTIRGVLGGVFSVFNFGLMFYYDVPLALAGTGVIALAVTLLVAIAYLQRREQRETVAIQARQTGVTLQLLTGIRKLRVAGAEVRAFGIWARLYAQHRRAKVRIARLNNIWKSFGAAFSTLSIGVLVVIVGVSPGGEAIKTGDFLAFMVAFTGCVSAMLMTASAAVGALSVVPQYQMVQPILQNTPEISAGQADPGVLTGEIAVDRVVFSYQPDAPPVLNDLTFRVKAGEFVAFVGPSGSGKSTILRLLLGFETPQSGAVSYDSHDFKELDVRAVRRQIGVVLQNGRLMPGDIFTNIIGCTAATLEQAWAATRMAGFDEDLKRMPMGMHTMVTDGGGTLSGGQRQRLMIARAIVGSPRMLFFDEATSALDNQTQAIVSRSLEQLHATRIVIAHRLSTIINADRIYVIEKGRITQSGAYAELMAQPGPFRELASRQLA